MIRKLGIGLIGMVALAGFATGNVTKTITIDPASTTSDTEWSLIGMSFGYAGPSGNAGVFASTSAVGVSILPGSLNQTMEGTINVKYDAPGGSNFVLWTNTIVGLSYSYAKEFSVFGFGGGQMDSYNWLDYSLTKEVDGVLQVIVSGTESTHADSDANDNSDSQPLVQFYTGLVNYGTSTSMETWVSSESYIDGSPLSTGVANGQAIALNIGIEVSSNATGTLPPTSGTTVTIFESSFDDPATIGSWTLGGGNVAWNADDTPTTFPGGAYVSGPNSLNFNDGVDYDDNGQASAASSLSPVFDLTNYTNTTMTFQCNYDSEDEQNYDIRRLRVIGAAGNLVDEQLGTANGSTLLGACDATGTWHAHTLTMDPNWGAITVEFDFDSVDAMYNETSGWAIDDLKVTGTDPNSITTGGNNTGNGNTGNNGNNTGNGNTNGNTTGSGDGNAVVTLNLYEQNFDTATVSEWTLGGTSDLKWDADAAPATVLGADTFVSGPNSLNYNNGTDYDNGLANTADAVSPAIDLTDALSATLTFQCNYHVEEDADDATFAYGDWRTIRIKATGSQTPVLEEKLGTTNASPLVGDCAAMGTWHTHTIQLDPAWGAVEIEFNFDSADDYDNDQAGWFIDDLVVAADVSSGGKGIVAGVTEGGSGGGGSNCAGSVAGGSSSTPMLLRGLLILGWGLLKARRI